MGKISKNQQERCIEREKLDSGWLAGWLAGCQGFRERERERGKRGWQMAITWEECPTQLYPSNSGHWSECAIGSEIWGHAALLLT
jgi:hypothetical protein